MKVIVIGATGSIGQLTVQELLKEGHKVTAFARNPQKLSKTNPNLSLLAVAALCINDVLSPIKSHAAVIITLCSVMSRPSILLT